MDTRELWEAENCTGDGDIARLTVNERTGMFGLLVTDKGVPKVIVLTREQVSKLLNEAGAWLVRAAIEESEERERSEKDAMWERGD